MRVDGKQIAANIFEELKQRVGELKKKNIVPHLAIILVGNDPASEAYVRQKKLKGEEIGAKVTVHSLSAAISQQKLLSTIEQLNNDNNVHGIIVQRPLPDHIDPALVNQSVDPKKDVDAFHPETKFEMPLAKAVLKILEKIYDETKGTQETKETNAKSTSVSTKLVPSVSFNPFLNWLKSKNIVVMGKGETGGGPTIELLKKMGIEPQVIDSKTQNPNEITKQADIVICAVGKSGVLNPQALKQGAILIAVGMFRGKDGKLHGDYEEANVRDIASFYTPVPGGIGPVNVAMLLKNVLKASEISLRSW